MRQRIVAGNWKMNTHRDSARQLARDIVEGAKGIERVGIILCPPFPYLPLVFGCLADSKVSLGAQNCHDQARGAFTGEVAAGMLRDVGCQYVILGHSERRHGLGETDAFINRKIKVALEAGLDVILCIGETAGERDAGQLEAVLTRQLGGSLAGIDTSVMARIVLAYEPVWAIGTGRTAEPAQAQEAHALVRHHLRKMHGEASATTPILYGGSVDRKKAPALFAEPDIDGGLIGGASLKADEFLDIIKAAQ